LQRRSEEFEMAFYLYVVDSRNHLLGVVSLRQLLLNSPSTPLRKIMISDVIKVTTDTDQEEVARLVANYNLIALPVVDDENKLVGIVTVDDIIDVMREEATEDIYALAGVEAEDRALGSPVNSVRRRLPWLLTSLGTSLLAAAALVALTAVRRDLTGPALMAFLIAASLAVAVVVLTAPLAAPGYATDPQTHVPVGSAFPGYVRVLSGPFNVAGALCLVFGALFSAYVYMPKRKLLRGRRLPPVVAQAYGAAAVAVNLVASLPRAGRALVAGRLNSRVPATLLIALGGFVPGVTSGLNRFGVTWSFFLGELLGVLLILAGFLVSEEILRDLPGLLPRRAAKAEAEGML
jgi:hypothetical protein